MNSYRYTVWTWGINGKSEIPRKSFSTIKKAKQYLKEFLLDYGVHWNEQGELFGSIMDNKTCEMLERHETGLTYEGTVSKKAFYQ